MEKKIPFVRREPTASAIQADVLIQLDWKRRPDLHLAPVMLHADPNSTEYPVGILWIFQQVTLVVQLTWSSTECSIGISCFSYFLPFSW